MTTGSGLFSTARPVMESSVAPGKSGLAGEIADLRTDVAAALGALAGIAVEELTNVVGTAAPGAAALLIATATVASPVTVPAASMIAAGTAQLALWARQLTFTTAGTTPADAPATATITGTDKDDAAQTETINLAQTAATVTTTKSWKTANVSYPAADGTGATVSIGIAAAALLPATATVTSAVTLTGDDLVQGDMSSAPRALVFTTGGTTPADAPATATITGIVVGNRRVTETVNLAQTAATATSAYYYTRVESIRYSAGDGTGATVAITPSDSVGLGKKIASRAGLISLIREIAAGSVVTNGSITDPATAKPNGAYTPNTAFDGVRDHAIYYDFDGSAP